MGVMIEPSPYDCKHALEEQPDQFVPESSLLLPVRKKTPCMYACAPSRCVQCCNSSRAMTSKVVYQETQMYTIWQLQGVQATGLLVALP